MMRVLVACEFSGVVREAFRARGHDAVSCDLLPTEIPGPHHQGDVREIIGDGFDLMLTFPPCTYLARSGAWRHWGSPQQREAVDFARWLMAAPIPRIALENPVGALNTFYRRPDMILQPWQYGHPESKATCLWLKGLPVLMVADWVGGPYDQRVYRMSPGPARQRERSRTLPGIAEAMAEQWGSLNNSRLSRISDRNRRESLQLPVLWRLPVSGYLS